MFLGAGAQQFDQYGKIFTVKVQYMFYKERPGVRPGQLSKAERITTRLTKFAQHAIAGRSWRQIYSIYVSIAAPHGTYT